MAAAPVYVGTPKTWLAQVSAANANRDGTGTIVDVVTAGASGSRIDYIEATAIVTTTAGLIRLYLFDGTNLRMWMELPTSAVTVSATNPADTVYLDLTDNPLVLPTGWKLRASIEKAEAFNVFARGGDF